MLSNQEPNNAYTREIEKMLRTDLKIENYLMERVLGFGAGFGEGCMVWVGFKGLEQGLALAVNPIDLPSFEQ